MLILAQVDDRSGEELGRALTRLSELGARNVQLLSSLTKKGRPGYVLLLDLQPEVEADISAFLAAELGVWGYHLVPSEHRHFTVEPVNRRLQVTCGSRHGEFQVRCKLFKQEERLLRVKVDQDDLDQLSVFLQEAGSACPAALVRAAIEREVFMNSSAEQVSLIF